MKNILFKIGLMVLWPFVTFFVLVVMVTIWPFIPLAKIKWATDEDS